MKPEELHEYTQDLIAQAKIIEQNLLELVVYSNGSISYDSIINMPVAQVKKLESIITKKIKQDKGIKEQSML